MWVVSNMLSSISSVLFTFIGYKQRNKPTNRRQTGKLSIHLDVKVNFLSIFFSNDYI